MESSLPSLVLSLYQVTLALPTHSQPRRARSRSKADIESLRTAEGARPSQPQWGGVKEGQGDTAPLGGAALQVFSRAGSSYVCRCMYKCIHVHLCACGGQRTSQLPFLRYLSLLLFETVSHWPGPPD